GQGVASGMPQHVDVDREWQLGAFACAFDHPGAPQGVVAHFRFKAASIMACQPPLMAPGALIQASIISSVGSRIAAMAAPAWSGVILAACATRSTMVLIDLAPPVQLVAPPQ